MSALQRQWLSPLPVSRLAETAVTDEGIDVMDLFNPQLETTDDVREWFGMLLDRGHNFHPDDDFAATVADASGVKNDAQTARVAGVPEGARVFSDTEARMMNEAMERACEICNAGTHDVYEVGMEVRREHGWPT